MALNDEPGGAPRPAGRVATSIIIASQVPEDEVRRCLDSLQDQLAPHVEVIVAYDASSLDPARLQRDFPRTTLAAAPPGASVPELRYRGLERAAGGIVAMTEAGARFTPGWLLSLEELHARGFDAVGGAIDPAPDFGLLSWAAHLCEYGAYMSPLGDLEGGDFSGFHCSYERALLDKCTESLRDRHWETVLHEEARRAGARFYRCGTLRLLNARRHRAGPFLRQRFAYGRGYGRVRALRTSTVAHGALLFATAGLPALMMFRYMRWMRNKRLPIARSIASLPLLALFAGAWSLGEWLGYVDAIPAHLRRGRGR
jgi:GT2 family glycosyltransferase